MNRFFVVLLLLVAIIVGAGFYLGWFQFGWNNVDNKPKVEFQVNKEKIRQDEKTAIEDLEKIGSQIKEKVTGQKDTVTDGTIVNFSNDTLTLMDSVGKEHSHLLASKVKVTCDGKGCVLMDLKAGMKVRVTTEKMEPHRTVRIEAIDNNKDFEKGA